MTGSEARKKIKHDPDFVYLKRFDYSLVKVLERYPEGCPDRIIAMGLMMTEEDVENLYQNILIKLRAAMNLPNETL